MYRSLCSKPRYRVCKALLCAISPDIESDLSWDKRHLPPNKYSAVPVKSLLRGAKTSFRPLQITLHPQLLCHTLERVAIEGVDCPEPGLLKDPAVLVELPPRMKQGLGCCLPLPKEMLVEITHEQGGNLVVE